MPTYKVSYFNITGLGEPVRFMLAYGGVPFEDHRIDDEKWPQLKSSFPMGQVPVLEIDGKQYHQSVPLCRYLGQTFNVTGKDDLENLEIDQVADTVNDFRQKIGAVHYEANADIKATKAEALKKDIVPFYLKKLEEIAKQNNGHLALGRLTWADLYFIGLLDYMNGMATFDLLANSPNLQKVKENVVSNANVKKYLATRPETRI